MIIVKFPIRLRGRSEVLLNMSTSESNYYTFRGYIQNNMTMLIIIIYLTRGISRHVLEFYRTGFYEVLHPHPLKRNLDLEILFKQMRVLLSHSGLNLPRIFGTSTSVPLDLYNRYLFPSEVLDLPIFDRHWFLHETHIFVNLHILVRHC